MVHLVLALLLVLQAADGARPRARDRFSPAAEERYSGAAGFVPTNGAPYFEFATESGVGMTSACACSALTGTKGEPLTLTRASSGTCLKGNVQSSIANGDMVTCATNQPRVMPGGPGIGPNGLLVEDARTNVAVRSQEIENAAWSLDSAGGGGLPTVTANAATAPDGTLTADRVQFNSCVGVDVISGLFQLETFAGAYTASVYVKGTSAAGSVSIGHYDLTAAAGASMSVAFNASTWTRVQLTRTNANANVRFYIGCLNFSAMPGATATAAADVLIWGGQFELGSFASSYIATAGATATRATELALFPVTTAFVSAGSAAASVYGPNVNIGRMVLATSANGRFLYVDGTTKQVSAFDGTNDIKLASPSSFSETVLNRVNADWGGIILNVRNVTDATSVTGAFDTTMASGTLAVATELTGNVGSHLVIKQVCLDPNPARCR